MQGVSKMSKPLVTVLMSVFNGERYLGVAIESILSQTYHNIEFLIINDASTDNSAAIISSYHDNRIRLITNPENLRLTKSLNKGIELANGKYIARMDADDKSLPERIERQVAFMERHPEVGLCGTFIRSWSDVENENYDVHFRTTHDEIKFKLFFDTHFPHPAAMLRKSVLEEHQLRYDTVNRVAQDYELWNKMADYCEIAIIPEVLVWKRTHAEMTSVRSNKEQLQVVRNIHGKLMAKLGVTVSERELDIYERFVAKVVPETKEDLFMLLDLFDKLIVGNSKHQVYSGKLFNTFFAEQYWMLCTTSTGAGIDIYKKYKQSVAKNYFAPGGLSVEKFFVKSLVRYKHTKAL